jgi:hypothetical protein
VRRCGPDVGQVGVAHPVAEDAAVGDERTVAAAEDHRVGVLVRAPVLLRRAPVVEAVRGQRRLERRPVDAFDAGGELDLGHRLTVSSSAKPYRCPGSALG